VSGDIIRAHAKLSASGSKKWLTCTRSAKLEEQFPDEQSGFALEGTFAHEVFEHVIHCYLEEQPVDWRQFEQNEFWSADLRDHVINAAQRAIDTIVDAKSRCSDPLVLVERRLDFSPWVPEGFGTGDLVVVSDGVLDVLDLKYGKGVPVFAQNNSQMRLYALGALNEIGHLYDIDRVRMTVLQPRLDNYDSEEIAASELLLWAESYVKPRAQMAWNGEGDYVPGGHCTSGFCKARFQCPARAEHALAVAKSEFALKPPVLLTRDQLVDVLSKADMAIDWLNDVKAFALREAEAGHEIPGYKLVEGRSNRKYIDADAVAERLLASGIEEALIYERSLLGLTAMEKALGKKKFAELLGDLVAKPPGKPTLARVDDKRPALSSAAADFQ
jgi:hypothetical protein